ncbi:hypothetical protein GCM10007067_16410 [Lysobacter bugurensis]|uniref:FAS1 domain-containing protein n=2 Tax=Cognatilysobacter bugurensis TaxID=543356 RepID=A0A918SZR9_9GAMM|nr:hypothetical protein GCM10007067_16410 [Lysobacter bugurensis]
MKRALLVLTIASTFALGACSEPAETAAVPAPAADTAPAAPMPMEPATTADSAPQNPMVGGAPMYADKDIVDNAVNSADHTTLVAAVKAAELVDTLKGPGPFTVFAPTNAAFEKLPAGTVDKLVTPEMKPDLTKVLTYHVVPGKVDAATLTSQIQAGNGSATLTTVQGGTLTANVVDGNVIVTDAKGNKATVTTADVMQSNGVIHVIDTVLMPGA